jgi:hypothetical protein
MPKEQSDAGERGTTTEPDETQALSADTIVWDKLP